MHIVGRRLDLRVTPSLCCKKWLEWCKCDHAWPFQDCSRPVTCTLLHDVSWGLAHGHVMSQRSWCGPDVSDCPAKLHSQSASLHSSLIWSDSPARITAGRSPCGWRFTHISDAEACQAAVMLMMDVSYFVFSVHLGPHDSLFFLNELIFCLAVRCVLFFGLACVCNSHLYVTWKDRMTLLLSPQDEEFSAKSSSMDFTISRLLFHKIRLRLNVFFRQKYPCVVSRAVECLAADENNTLKENLILLRPPRPDANVVPAARRTGRIMKGWRMRVQCHVPSPLIPRPGPFTTTWSRPVHKGTWC